MTVWHITVLLLLPPVNCTVHRRAKTGKQVVVTVEVRTFFVAVHVLMYILCGWWCNFSRTHIICYSKQQKLFEAHPSSFISRALHSLELARVHVSCSRSHQDSQHALEDSLDRGRRYGKLLFLRMSPSRSPGILLIILLSSIQQPCRYAREINLWRATICLHKPRRSAFSLATMLLRLDNIEKALLTL